MNKLSNRQINRLFVTVLTVILCGLSVQVHGQNVTSVTLNMSDVPLRRVMTELENQTKYLFLYTDDIDTGRIVSVNAASRPLTEVLESIFRGTGIDFNITTSNIVLSTAATAPAARTVTGVVRDARGDTIIGAMVLLAGTNTGATTGINGEFSLVIPASVREPELTVTYLGYETIKVMVGSRSFVDIVLEESVIEVDEVVVTALGIKRAEKALSYNVQQVSAESIVANKDANFINSLNGKVAGVNVNASSVGVGGSTQVIMRGTKSIMQSSNALYVVDGVPMQNVAGGGDTEFGSRGTTDPIADINPEDIESLSVLTGAAAAALYGSDAANGAIVIVTKKGQAGRLSVTVAGGLEMMSPFVLPSFQNRYGTGDYNSAIGSEIRSWGRLLNNSNYVGYDPASDYFNTGAVGTGSVSLSTGTERNQTYFSAASVNSKGVVPNNRYDRYNFTFRNTTLFLDGRMTLDVNANYVLQYDRNMINQGTYNNPIVGAYIFPRGNDWEDIKLYERYDPTRSIYTQYWPVGDAGMTMQNPYWVNYRNLRENNKDRYMFSTSLSYDILDWLNIVGRVRIDNSYNDYTEKSYASTNQQLTELSSYGLYGITKSASKQAYGDVLVNINKTFGDDWSLQVNAGASVTDMRYDEMAIRGPIADGIITDETPGLTNVFNIQNLSNTSSRVQAGWREQTQSVFASAELGYRSTYYLTVTGRNDWPSALAGPYSTSPSFFYPSVGFSLVLSELMPKMERLPYVKLRGSFASVGNAFERYLANPGYPWNSAGARWDSALLNYPVSLNPERTSSYEVGLTMRFMKHFNLDFTYYRANTRDQTFNPGISAGSGYSNIYIQSGNVLNHGVEAALGYTNSWNKFTWSSNYTLSTNRNKILELADNVVNPVTGEIFSVDLIDMGGVGQAHFLLMEGGSLGDLYSFVDLTYDDNGKIYVAEDGTIPTQAIQDFNRYVKLGSVLPDANMSWRNDFSYGNFNFGFMLSARIGGVVFSQTQSVLDYYGVSEATAAARDAGSVIINGGDVVDPNMWYSAIAGGAAIPQYYTYSATNVRLQEASIGYLIPRKWIRNIGDITVSLVGRNLWMIYNKAPFDPETIATVGNFYQGLDNFMMPSLRNVGFNLRINF